MPRKTLFWLIVVICFWSAPVRSQTTQQPSKIAWWQEASFGILFHWGLYAVPAGELSGRRVDGPAEVIMKNANLSVADYEKFANDFNPQSFHAKEWATLAKNAGAKYVIITAKHLDGFCLWDSKLTKYDVVDTAAYRRDVVGALSAACKEAGLKFGVYYAMEDWHHPDANEKSWKKYIEEYVKPQLKELVENYPTDIVMLREGPKSLWNKDMADNLVQYIYTLKSGVIVNRGSVGTPSSDFPGDYVSTFSIPTGTLMEPTELVVSMNDTWGFKTTDTNWKPSKSLVNSLIEVNVAGGNFLLNVGPKSFGTMAPETIFRLYEIGRWLKQNGEAVYKAVPYDAPHASPATKFMKSADGKWIYVFLTEPKVKSFKLSSLKLRKGIKPIVLGTTKALTISENKGVHTLSLPDGYDYDYSCVIKIPVVN
jgi:alpha-L-fucosidase